MLLIEGAVPLLSLLLFFSSHTAVAAFDTAVAPSDTAVAPSDTAVAAFDAAAAVFDDWWVRRYRGDQCDDSGVGGVDYFDWAGNGSWCLIDGGGKSWRVKQDVPIFRWSSWSGTYCRGSSTPPISADFGCQKVPFTSLEVYGYND